jgi:hypothetical protein
MYNGPQPAANRTNSMTFAEFKKKWARYTGKESSAYASKLRNVLR